MTHPTAIRLACSLLLLTFVVLELHTVVRGELPTVAAVLETRPSLGDDEGGNAGADDPAIWVHPIDATKSLVVSTLKEGGLDVYDLSGGLVQHVPPDAAGPGLVLNRARYNNVDVIYGFR
jgi:3-phytase